ncbi:MAG: hypothetical protein U9N14_05265 [Pseudomonadota bacterium]|nr:hypothetical protein [Pseudomonadota bacterium]
MTDVTLQDGDGQPIVINPDKVNMIFASGHILSVKMADGKNHDLPMTPENADAVEAGFDNFANLLVAPDLPLAPAAILYPTDRFVLARAAEARTIVDPGKSQPECKYQLDIELHLEDGTVLAIVLDRGLKDHYLGHFGDRYLKATGQVRASDRLFKADYHINPASIKGLEVTDGSFFRPVETRLHMKNGEILQVEDSPDDIKMRLAALAGPPKKQKKNHGPAGP